METWYVFVFWKVGKVWLENGQNAGFLSDFGRGSVEVSVELRTEKEIKNLGCSGVFRSRLRLCFGRVSVEVLVEAGPKPGPKFDSFFFIFLFYFFCKCFRNAFSTRFKPYFMMKF